MRKPNRWDRRLGAFLRGVFGWPVVGILAVSGIRFARVSNPGRIGHLAAELDCFLKERALGLIPDERPVLLLERRRAGNVALLDLFRPHFRVWDHRWQRLLFAEFARIPALRLPLGRPVLGLGESARYPQILSLWGDRPPVVELPEELDARGRALLAKLGVPEGAWFVSIHAREAGYSPRDDADHAHRNSSIGTYEQAIAAIRARGGWVIRVGDPSMTPLPAMDGVIDYAVSPLKRDWMDIWLCARNRFFLGSSSGLAIAATIFHRPCVLVNMIPLGASYGMAEADISIPKRIRDAEGRVLALSEIVSSGLSVQRYAQVFEERGVSILDNTPEEISAVAEEMLDRLDGSFTTTEDDEALQRKFRSHLRPLDYSYGALARIGRDWLRENRDLI